MSEWHGGKGSGRRNEDSQAVRDGWERIFGAKAPVSSPSAAGLTGKEIMMNEHEYEHDDDNEIDNEEYDETEGRICPVCRGHMVVTATGMYMFCDTCGHREELDNDDYL
jgi:hypothetical protein